MITMGATGRLRNARSAGTSDPARPVCRRTDRRYRVAMVMAAPAITVPDPRLTSRRARGEVNRRRARACEADIDAEDHGQHGERHQGGEHESGEAEPGRIEDQRDERDVEDHLPWDCPWSRPGRRGTASTGDSRRVSAWMSRPLTGAVQRPPGEIGEIGCARIFHHEEEAGEALRQRDSARPWRRRAR